MYLLKERLLHQLPHREVLILVHQLRALLCVVKRVHLLTRLLAHGRLIWEKVAVLGLLS